MADRFLIRFLDSEPPLLNKKESVQNELSAQIKNFSNNGGEIQKIAPGVSAYKDLPVKLSQNEMLKYKKQNYWLGSKKQKPPKNN